MNLARMIKRDVLKLATVRSGPGKAGMIKSNMRCIETQMQLITVSVRKPIKSNMRCIETILESELVLNSDR